MDTIDFDNPKQSVKKLGLVPPESLLLVLQLPIFRSSGRFWIDRQAHNGLHRWLDNFDTLTVCMPVLDVIEPPADTMEWRAVDFAGRCAIICLPSDRSMLGFLRLRTGVARELDALIDTHTHLSFALGGLFGDWAAYAGLRASRKKREFSIWTDRVESQVIGFHACRSHGLRKIYWRLIADAMTRYERIVIRRSSLGLFHGADCYSAYARYSSNPHLVHDIHLKEEDRITDDELAAKVGRAGGPLRIVYAGRAHAEKGIFDWIETVSLLRQKDVDFTATWYGDGPELQAAREAVSVAGLKGRVAFPGPLLDRERLLRAIKAADIFLFCHKTAESPRCLIEALVSGTPIVGYSSAYPQDLIAKHAGGLLVEHAPAVLAAAVTRLADDREMMSGLVSAAAADGHGFNDKDVFRHRSDLIKSAA